MNRRTSSIAAVSHGSGQEMEASGKRGLTGEGAVRSLPRVFHLLPGL